MPFRRILATKKQSVTEHSKYTVICPSFAISSAECNKFRSITSHHSNPIVCILDFPSYNCFAIVLTIFAPLNYTIFRKER